MGLFGKKKQTDLEQKGASVEPVTQSHSEELQSLLSEFRQARQEDEENITRASVYDNNDIEEVIEDDHHEDAEEYEVSESESESIEDFLSGEDEEEIVEEEPIEEEIEDEETDEIIEDEETIEEIIEEEPEEEIIEEPIEEQIEDEEIDEIVEEDEELVDEELEDEIVDEEVQEEIPVEEELQDEIIGDNQDEPVIENEEEQSSNFVTSEDLDKKFDDFEDRLLTKLMSQLSGITAGLSNKDSQKAKKEAVKNTIDEDDLVVKTVRGKLVINDYEFNGEVVMFTPINTLKKASWEDVVRRKGHCTYHLTSSGNGGWFIKKSNAPNPYAYIEKKEDAEELAKFYAKREKAELKIHNSKGVIEQSLSFGREKLRG